MPSWSGQVKTNSVISEGMTESHCNHYMGTGALGALGRRFESCRPDQSETGFPACLF